MAKSFNQLTISDKIKETEDSYSFLFEIPDSLSSQYDFLPGQYLTLKVTVAGEELRRAYSIFTAPSSGKFGFTVKRVEGGKVSNFLIDQLNASDQLEVMPPEGKFTLRPERTLQRDHYFFAGGSGVTPIMSMIDTVLADEPLSTCYFLYANRTENDIIFYDKLNTMAENYKGQLVVKHILSQPAKEKVGGIKGLFGKKTASWRGLQGRCNNSILTRYIDDHPSKSNNNTYYLCGPSGLIERVEAFLQGQGISQGSIKKEYFTAANDSPKAVSTAATGSAATAEVKLNGKTVTIDIASDQTVLDALIDKGYDPPYSCTSGACSTCVAKVTEGEVTMDACFALDDEEVADGYVLTCQSKVASGHVKIDYES